MRPAPTTTWARSSSSPAPARRAARSLTLLLSVRGPPLDRSPDPAPRRAGEVGCHQDLPDAVQTRAGPSRRRPVPHLAAFEVGTSDELADLATSFNSVQDAAVDLAAEQAMRPPHRVGEPGQHRPSQPEPARPYARLHLHAGAGRARSRRCSTTCSASTTSPLACDATRSRCWCWPAPSRPACGRRRCRSATSCAPRSPRWRTTARWSSPTSATSACRVRSPARWRTCSPSCWRTPPASRRRPASVTVVGRAVPDGHQLAIFDYGLGMTAEDLADANRRLNQVSSFDRESNKMLGFQVVARLAARHDIKVMLTTTPGGTGVTAIVRLPKSILEVVVPPAHRGAGGRRAGGAQRCSPSRCRSWRRMAVEPVTARGHRARSTPPRCRRRPVGVDARRAPARRPRCSGSPMQRPCTAMAPPAPTSRSPSSPASPSACAARRCPSSASTLDGRPRRAPADEVRSTLASLQRGVDLGRQHGDDELIERDGNRSARWHSLKRRTTSTG